MLIQRTYEEITAHSRSKSTAPCEEKNSLLGGLLVHFGPIAGFCLLTEMNHFAPLATFLAFCVISLLTLFFILLSERFYPSVEMDPLERNDFIHGLGFVFIKGLGMGGIAVVFSWWIFHSFFPHYSLSTWPAIFLTVAAADFFYYFIHRFLNHSRTSGYFSRWYRKNHAAHHAVKALDFLRGNHSSTLDTSIFSFQIPTALAGALLGLDLVQTLVAYTLVLLLQTTHHVNFTYNIGWLRYIFVDNHNHKLHHCPRGSLVNFGAVFSIWDRLFGTCYENWSLCSNYLEKNRMALPIQRKKVIAASMPSEPKGKILVGCLGQFGPGLTILIATAFTQQSPVFLLITFIIASSLAVPLFLSAEKHQACVDLPPVAFKENIKGMMHVFLTAVVAGGTVITVGWCMLHKLAAASPIHLSIIVSIIAAVILSDLFYYLLHRFLNHGKTSARFVRWFRKNHHIHHNIAHLDFMRGSISSFADTAITGFQFPLLCASTILGMSLVPTLVAYSLLLVLEGTHHVNAAFNIGKLRYLFIDNHAHKMHHCLGGYAVNHGVIFSLWDRFFGTYYENRDISPSYMKKHRIPLPIGSSKL